EPGLLRGRHAPAAPRAAPMARQINSDHAEAITQLFDQAIPDAHVEAPTVKQHEIGTGAVDLDVQIVHLTRVPRAPLAQARASASTSASTCCSVCAADNVTRSRELPCGTVGGRMATTQNPAASSSCCALTAASASPITTG